MSDHYSESIRGLTPHERWAATLAAMSDAELERQRVIMGEAIDNARALTRGGVLSTVGSERVYAARLGTILAEQRRRADAGR